MNECVHYANACTKLQNFFKELTADGLTLLVKAHNVGVFFSIKQNETEFSAKEIMDNILSSIQSILGRLDFGIIMWTKRDDTQLMLTFGAREKAVWFGKLIKHDLNNIHLTIQQDSPESISAYLPTIRLDDLFEQESRVVFDEKAPAPQFSLALTLPDFLQASIQNKLGEEKVEEKARKGQEGVDDEDKSPVSFQHG